MGRFAAGLPSLEASVGRPLVHLAALATAREHNQQYDWTMTEVAALKDGLDTRIVDVARQRKALDGVGEREAVVIQFARELFGQHYVTTQTYARALKVFGLRDLSDLVTGVMAQHARDATLLSAFDQQLPAGQVPLLPLP